jgi:hypothetical protein
MTSRPVSPLRRCTALVLALACVFAAGCKDKQQPKPITWHAAPAATR